MDEGRGLAGSSGIANQSTKGNVAKLCELGYDYDMADAALRNTKMDLHKAIDLLVETSGTVPRASKSGTILFFHF